MKQVFDNDIIEKKDERTSYVKLSDGQFNLALFDTSQLQDPDEREDYIAHIVQGIDFSEDCYVGNNETRIPTMLCGNYKSIQEAVMWGSELHKMYNGEYEVSEDKEVLRLIDKHLYLAMNKQHKEAMEIRKNNNHCEAQASQADSVEKEILAFEGTFKAFVLDQFSHEAEEYLKKENVEYGFDIQVEKKIAGPDRTSQDSRYMNETMMYVDVKMAVKVGDGPLKVYEQGVKVFFDQYNRQEDGWIRITPTDYLYGERSYKTRQLKDTTRAVQAMASLIGIALNYEISGVARRVNSFNTRQEIQQDLIDLQESNIEFDNDLPRYVSKFNESSTVSIECKDLDYSSGNKGTITSTDSKLDPRYKVKFKLIDMPSLTTQETKDYVREIYEVVEKYQKKYFDRIGKE